MGVFTTNGLFKPDAEEGGVAGLLNDNWDKLDAVLGGAGANTPLVVNPMDPPYSAAGNGSTDDLTKINTAISDLNTAGGGILYLTKLHAVKGKVVLKSNVRIVAAHQFAGIKAVATFVGSVMIEGTGGVSWTQVMGCMLDGNSLVATGVSVGAGGTNAGHNVIMMNQLKNFTTVAIDCGATLGGSETHVIRNDITGSASGILSGPDNHIVQNNMGSITSVGIQLNSGGNQMIDNHIVTSGSSANCFKVTSGFVNIIVGNYFDSSATQSASMGVLAPGSGKTSADSILAHNTFFAQNLSADNTYFAITVDQATGGGTIDNWLIKNNMGRAKSGFRWAAVFSLSGTATNFEVDGNRFMYCVGLGALNPSKLGNNTIYDGTTYKIGRPRIGKIAITYSASMTPDAAFGDVLVITATNGTAFTINNPSNPLDGMRMTITLANGSGGALGAATWGTAYRFDAATAPANPGNGKERSISFYYSNTDSKWHEVGRSTADV